MWPWPISSAVACRTPATVHEKTSAMPASGWLPSSTTCEGNGVQLAVVVAILAGALELHADFDVVGKQRARLDDDKLGVVVAEGILRLQFELQHGADGLALQSLFDAREDAVITAVQVDDGLLAFIDGIAVAVGDAVVEGDDGVPGDLHDEAFFPLICLTS